MPTCPNCSIELNRHTGENGLTFICHKCGGQAIGIGALHKADISGEWLKHVWESACKGNSGSRTCPHCFRPLALVTSPAGQRVINLEICIHCHSIWFDKGENLGLPRNPPPPPSPKPISERSKLALMKVELETRRETYDMQHLPPASTWQKVMAVFGFPVEENSLDRKSFPYITWGTAFICILVYLIFYGQLDFAAETYGFIPAEPFRLGGYTILASFFLHGSFLHLAGNLYFLIVFGDNVEILMGKIKFALLLFISHFAGLAAHFLFYTNSDIPLVGASAGILGVVAFYAAAFPKARITQLFIIYFRPYWMRIHVGAYLFFFILFQFAWLIQDAAMIRETSGIAFFAHFGGLATGIIAGVWMRLGDKEKSPV